MAEKLCASRAARMTVQILEKPFNRRAWVSEHLVIMVC